ncbi:MAG: hypothetical protein HY851_02720 [candidate division Zixibacteria bacterium]|nr:hypothetical protein [candidate division Zixibacteria bacterium]
MYRLHFAGRLFAWALIALMAVGCLISGTFVIIVDLPLTATSGYYWCQVDVTTKQAWADHKDDIDQIDAIGLDLWMTNADSVPVTINVNVADYSDGRPMSPGLATNIYQLTVNPGADQHITYAQSLALIRNTDRLKALVKTGKFNVEMNSTVNLGSTFTVDSGKVIITFSASGS